MQSEIRDSERPMTGIGAFPARVSRLVAVGPLVGTVTGTVSYFLQIWLTPGFESQPQGMYVWVLTYNMLVWTTWLLLLPVKWWLAARVPITAGRRTLPLAFHAVTGLVVSVGHCAVDAALKYGLLSIAGQQRLLGRPLEFVPVFTWTLLFAFEWQVLLYWGIVAAYHAIAASRTLERRRLEEARLETDLVEARLESLQRQLNPHFFFNALNAISTLLDRDPRAAEGPVWRAASRRARRRRRGAQRHGARADPSAAGGERDQARLRRAARRRDDPDRRAPRRRAPGAHGCRRWTRAERDDGAHRGRGPVEHPLPPRAPLSGRARA
jgi:hypothetical protein